MAGPRKSSSRITLVFLGAAALAACGQEGDGLRRDVYTSKDDCLKDWGDELKCEEQSAPPGGVRHGAYWYGPAYRSGQFGSSGSSRPGGSVDSARPGSRAVATSHVSHGGFGASGAAHASSGT
ncbi:MAG: hypothetical protein E6H67_03275 [Betaproteobacteria bacterium]|nr:MAG: hypothetical protein E6H74_04885 [Betaproteobacteria bacterium]TMH07605.1 MAG: hypothetical protein E6H67_03275 [Betaproteobacteria bacterium]